MREGRELERWELGSRWSGAGEVKEEEEGDEWVGGGG